MTAKPEITRASAELEDLAVAVRPDWDREAVSAAITAATVSGMPWPRMLAELVRLMTRPDGSPRELREMAADPRQSFSHDPDAYRNGVAAARAALGRTA